MGVSQVQEYPFGGPYSKDLNTLGSMLGSMWGNYHFCNAYIAKTTNFGNRYMKAIVLTSGVPLTNPHNISLYNPLHNPR